ncbi:hypothetical protein IJ135_01510 [Candidatus Saccharibacteria bacterium]|nr:hypothetical protein [Candidatus Saccharibacteria bacterium]
MAELTSVFGGARKIGASAAVFESESLPNINRLGGVIKIAEPLEGGADRRDATNVVRSTEVASGAKGLTEFLKGLPEGKITLGLSDYSKNTNAQAVKAEAMKLKKILVRHGHSVRLIEVGAAVIPTATVLHNGLSGKNPKKVELIRCGGRYYRTIGVQDIDAYARRDQARPARDARVGMLPPKLAQILINLCGPLPEGARVLDPFCGTGVVLQEALLMGYRAYGTDLEPRMVEYSLKNLKWLVSGDKIDTSLDTLVLARRYGARFARSAPRWSRMVEKSTILSPSDLFTVSQGDATNYTWAQPIDAVACEAYLGRPMSTIPPEIKLKQEKQVVSGIILQFLKNLAGQIKPGTPVVVAMPAWLRADNTYSRLNILDEIEKLEYNVSKTSLDGLLYFRVGQIVARDIIILRKK